MGSTMKKTVAIIGGSTSGLLLAAFLDTNKYNVTIYEKNAALGRKFLVAGNGGFNLTHSEELATFKAKYTPPNFLENALNHFSNDDFRTWLQSIDIPTFVGSSGRVFPEKGIKPIKVLKTIEAILKVKNVKFQFNKTFTGWAENNALLFNSQEMIEADNVIYALGGASWKVTGSDGSWLKLFTEKGIATEPFKPANCAYAIDWHEHFIQKHEGKPLKNIAISIVNKIQKGEAVVTKFGIEGNAIYGLSPEVQVELDSKNEATVYIDFKPTIALESLIEKLSFSTRNVSLLLREKIKRSRTVIDLLKSTLTKEQFIDLQTLVRYIKNFPIKITAAAPIDEAISTTGGISLTAVNSDFELKTMKNNFCIGEMLDWNAPTGGYLIQACASMGVSLAGKLNDGNFE